MEHLLMHLESPAMSFGGIAVDNRWNTDQFPGAALLTGLLGNALGWEWSQSRLLQNLQNRLVFAARIDREPTGAAPLTDFQTAYLNHNDRAWTTRGRPEGRAGSAATYRSPNLRFRQYYADMSVMVALRLSGTSMQDAAGPVTLSRLSEALQYPARPLFIGRKPFIPSVRIFAGFAEGDTALAALLSVPARNGAANAATDLRDRDGDPEPDGDGNGNGNAPQTQRVRLTWPPGEGCPDIKPVRTRDAADLKNWDLYIHGGRRQLHEGYADIPCAPTAPATASASAGRNG